ncbi:MULTISPECIES: GNAT family N-acetyltransferase [unclassified Streptomyces]|uniref:GNAT family N-acetyltransferase n=1 Tax=unclassified Streptomyces TaxID=2593676 RepID=UPI0022B5FB06|nr:MULTISPECIES: GNAT family N-acetyltransferase [unclassified Streptomyces]MCZ7415382.1 GNAT family N-acetyltransferase [Streptomyces sp. WMMC897]MCZ7432304.1 GNAT family N-acetyltransferase [Streptomyces sp. WMMC1477]
MREDVILRRLDETLLSALLEAAVADADPVEVMPPVPGPPGWTAERRAAFLRFHRSRSRGLAAAPVETTYAVLVGWRVVGAARLCPESPKPPEPPGPVPEPGASGAPGAVEAGVWLGRSARGAGVGRAVLAGLTAEARAAGFAELVAHTTPDNAGARRLLEGCGARASVTAQGVTARVELREPGAQTASAEPGTD